MATGPINEEVVERHSNNREYAEVWDFDKQANMIFEVESVLMFRGRASAAQSALAIDNRFNQVLKNCWSPLKMSKPEP